MKFAPGEIVMFVMSDRAGGKDIPVGTIGQVTAVDDGSPRVRIPSLGLHSLCEPITLKVVDLPTFDQRLTFETYQEFAAQFIVYPPENERRYLARAVRAEAGEIQGVLASMERGDTLPPDAMLKECGDQLWNLAMGYRAMGVAEMDPRWWPRGADNMTAELWADNLYEYSANFGDALIRHTPSTLKLNGSLIAYCICRLTDMSIEQVMRANLEKLARRKVEKTLKKGDRR
jgi:hypothetical protein